MTYKMAFARNELIIYLILSILELVGFFLFIATFWFYSIIFALFFLMTLGKFLFEYRTRFSLEDDYLLVKPANKKIAYEKIEEVKLRDDSVVVVYGFGKHSRELFVFCHDFKDFYNKIQIKRRNIREQ